MIRPIDLLRQDRKEELWQMCCGFIDLSLEQFMTTQKRLLLEQIELLKNCELGRKIMCGAMPTTVEEFREQVPLTTYADYCPELLKRREDVLPAKAVYWVHTLGKLGESRHREDVLPEELAYWVRIMGRFGEYLCKWVPISEQFAFEYEKIGGALTLLASCRSRGDTSQLREHRKALHTMGPAKYASGILAYLTRLATDYDWIPSNADDMSFDERIKAGFDQALCQGIDSVSGIPSVLVYVGEQFEQRSRKLDTHLLLSHPSALLRVIRGSIKSKSARRPLLPKDLWSMKGVLIGGTDSAIFSKRVKELWGREPLQVYAGAEGGVYATQTWDYEGMTFVPNLNFFEFIPEKEYFKWQLGNSYQPKTLLLDEVKPGNYELVITSFHGGPFVRYKLGHLVKIISSRNEQLDIDIPQMVFLSRIDDQIDIAGFTRLSEKVIWQAIENTGLAYEDWTARKEVKDKPVLHLYVELKENGYVTAEQVAAAAHNELKKLDTPYAELESFTGLRPLEVTLLPENAFRLYKMRQQAAGAELAHLKPPHINPSDDIIKFLVSAKRKVEVRRKEKVEA